jgi:hydrogenase maturation protein HypF
MIAGVVSDARRGVWAGRIARRFHDTLADAILAAVARIAESTRARHVLFSGGVFQNMTLLARVLSGARERGLSPLIHRKVPANDGGISLGQAYYAAQRVAGG